MADQKDKTKIIVQLNFFGPPLKKEEISKILAPETRNTVYEFTADLLNSFFDLPVSALSEEILERYVEASIPELHVPVAPYTKKISERLLKPLRGAKKNYCLGDYSATIALCGTVAEMLTILLWKINEFRVMGSQIDVNGEKKLFGRELEKLGQCRRLEVLETLGFITRSQFQDFDNIRKSRRPYLHLWNADLNNEKQDSLDTFKTAFRLFKDITGIGLADAGTVKVDPKMLKLLQDAEY